jgi:hypothetical protein
MRSRRRRGCSSEEGGEDGVKEKEERRWIRG